MIRRLVAVTLLLAASLGGPARAQSPQPVMAAGAEAGGETGRGCLAFRKTLDEGAAAHPGDFLALAPAARARVSVSGNRLCLDGLAFGTRYTVTVHPGIAYADGTEMHVGATVALDIPDRDRLVAVAGRGWILPRQGATGVTIQTVNVPEVRIRVLRVSERSLAANVPAAARGDLRPDPARQSFSLGDLQWYTRNAMTVIWSGTMQTTPGRNQTVETAFPLAGIVDPTKPGAYIVLAEDAAKPAAKLVRADDNAYDNEAYNTQVAGHWVLTTDLGLSSLVGQDGLHVTVRALGTAQPVAGVALRLLALGQDVLGEATTGPDGGAVFPPGLLHGKRAAAAAVLLASTEAGDMAVQDLTAPAFDLADRGADGRVVPGPIEAYVYTDRGIYRPGETVQVMALLRSHGLAAVDNTGLTLLLHRPDGLEASRFTLPPQPAAGFHEAIALSATAAQGDWTVEAYLDPTLPPIGRAAISVQDFVPQQLAVALTGPTAPIAPGAHLKASLDGRFLYGAPAAGLHAEGDVRLERDEHPVAAAREYSFGLAGETIPDATQTLTLDEADAQGHVAIDTELKLPQGVASPLRAVLEAGLTEPGGRVVLQTLTIPVATHDRLIGLRKLFAGNVDDGSAAVIALRAFAADGAPVAQPGMAWRLVREERHWDWWRGQDGNGPWSFHFHVIDAGIANGTLDLPADRALEWSRTLDWGDYRFEARDAASGAASSVRFSVGWGEQEAAADVPDRLEVTADRKQLGVGQTARVHLRGPFAGAAQVVVESAGRILETRAVDLPAGGTTIELTASTDWGAGVHVLAAAYRPLAQPARAHDPARAVGLVWIASDPAPHTLGVAIGGARLVTPRQTIVVPINVTGAHGPAFVTLAAVDEGILQLTKFATPDPVGTLLGRTRLGLDMRDDYGLLLEGQAKAGALREGGGGDDSLGGAGLPVTTVRVVSLWHGPVALDAAGNAAIPLDLPDFAGELRLMAVAYDHDAAGRAEAALTVRDPVVADVALPRFLAPGDAADITLSLADTDGPAGEYHLALEAGGAVALRGPMVLDTALATGERRQARTGLAGREIGIGHLHAVLTGPGNLRITHDWDIAVRSPHPDLVLSRTESQAPGATYRPDVAMLAPFLRGSVQLTVGYSNLGGIDVPALLQSLYTYPYGCTEQLSSSAWPLLYFDDARLLGRPAGDPAVRKRVQQAIDTIADRQDGLGRFGLWREGDEEASTWLNVYALDFLQHAREAGFSVPDRVTSASARWIDRTLREDPSDQDRGAYAQPAAPTRAYAAYVLARTGRVDPERLRVLRHDLAFGTWDGGVQFVKWNDAGLAAPLALAQLAGAQSLMGDAAGAEETFRLSLGNLAATEVPAWWAYGYYWTRLRDEAGVLAIAAETGHPDIAAELVGRLGARHPDAERMNTQEKAWLLAAAHALLKQDATRAFSMDDAAPQTVKLPFAWTPTVEAIGRGTSLRNADDKPVFRTVTLRGAPAKAPPALSEGLSVERRTLTLNGEPFDAAHLRQTDRFIVVLTGHEEDATARRLVINDPLAAGLEIEAPVLREEAYPFLGELSSLRAHEQRDDRFMAAFDIGGERDREVDDSKKNQLGAGEFRVAYIVRAVTPGRFVQPETVVQDMYRPEVMARTAAGETVIAPR